MFFGEFNHQVDAKNRIRIPFRFKEELGSEYVFCVLQEDVVSVYPIDAVEEKFGLLKEVSPFDADASDLVIACLSTFAKAEEDNQGRVIIPEVIREAVKLGKDIVSVGAGDHIKIMAKKKREDIKAKLSSKDALKKLDELYKASRKI